MFSIFTVICFQRAHAPNDIVKNNEFEFFGRGEQARSTNKIAQIANVINYMFIRIAALALPVSELGPLDANQSGVGNGMAYLKSNDAHAHRHTCDTNEGLMQPVD